MPVYSYSATGADLDALSSTNGGQLRLTPLQAALWHTRDSSTPLAAEVLEGAAWAFLNAGSSAHVVRMSLVLHPLSIFYHRSAGPNSGFRRPVGQGPMCPVCPVYPVYPMPFLPCVHCVRFKRPFVVNSMSGGCHTQRNCICVGTASVQSHVFCTPGPECGNSGQSRFVATDLPRCGELCFECLLRMWYPCPSQTQRRQRPSIQLQPYPTGEGSTTEFVCLLPCLRRKSLRSAR